MQKHSLKNIGMIKMDEDERHEDYPTTEEEWEALEKEKEVEAQKWNEYCHKVAREIRQMKEEREIKRNKVVENKG